MIIKIATSVGVTGTIGANAAGIFASFGNAKVYCVGCDIKRVGAIKDNLVPADFQ